MHFLIRIHFNWQAVFTEAKMSKIVLWEASGLNCCGQRKLTIFVSNFVYHVTWHVASYTCFNILQNGRNFLLSAHVLLLRGVQIDSEVSSIV